MKTPKITLATLSKLAQNALGDARDTGDEGAGAELKAHVMANADAYAALLGVSSARLSSWIDGVPVHKAARAVADVVKDRNAKLREFAGAERDRKATAAADVVTASATLAGDVGIGVVELDVVPLRAALGCQEPRVRVTLASGSYADVDGRMLREILAVRPDARVFVHTLEHPGTRVVARDEPWRGLSPVRVAWTRGALRGGMTLRALEPADTVPSRVIYVPDPFAPFAVRDEVAAVAANDVEEVQAAE